MLTRTQMVNDLLAGIQNLSRESLIDFMEATLRSDYQNMSDEDLAEEHRISRMDPDQLAAELVEFAS